MKMIATLQKYLHKIIKLYIMISYPKYFFKQEGYTENMSLITWIKKFIFQVLNYPDLNSAELLRNSGMKS